MTAVDPMPATAARRTQAERRVATRTALLNATIDCLAELGYGGTTTTEVVRRARVSRGAQVHHYPTKAELVAASMAHLFDRRHQEFRVAFAALPETSRTYSGAIDLLWPMFEGPTFDAWLELVVASRTDPELATKMAEVSARFDANVARLLQDLFGSTQPGPPSEVGVEFVFAMLEGLALHRNIRHVEHAASVIRALKFVAAAVESGQLALNETEVPR